MIDRTKLRYYGGDKMDQIIDIFTGSMTISSPTSSDVFRSTTNPHAHNFGDSAYFQGRFTTNNGNTWNDFGSMTPNFSGSVPAFQTADCNAYIDENNVYVKGISWYDYGNSIGRSYTIQYELFAIAKNVMAKPITPKPTLQKYSLNARNNYEKIAIPSSIPISVASGAAGSVSVPPHNLGKIPRVRAWFFHQSSPNICRPLLPDYTEGLYSQIEVRITSSTLSFYVDATDFSAGANGVIEYRIYYD